jgi:heavy metal sensor kinase
MIKHLNSLSIRLVLWYASVLGLTFVILFGLFYVMIRSHFDRWTDEELQSEAEELAGINKKHGIAGVTLLMTLEEETEKGQFFGRVIDEHGRPVFETASLHSVALPVNSQIVSLARTGSSGSEIVKTDGYGIVRILYYPLSDGNTVQLAMTLHQHEVWLRRFSKDLVKVVGVALALSIAAGIFLARRALSPIQTMAQAASGISGSTLGPRMPITGTNDELDQLAAAFNDMLGRIDNLFSGLREVTDSLAHDLRTPLAGIRGMAEVILRAPREADEYKRGIYQIIEQLDYVQNLFDNILDVSQADAGVLALRCEDISIDDLIDHIFQTFEPVASDKGISFEKSITGGLTLRADRGRLAQILSNLLDNAIKYSTRGDQIRLFIGPSADGKSININVIDSGKGISAEDLPHIFERYYRGDKSRSGPGAGLGLPLVRGIVEAHGGTVTVQSQAGKGTAFTVFLPLEPDSPRSSEDSAEMLARS